VKSKRMGRIQVPFDDRKVESRLILVSSSFNSTALYVPQVPCEALPMLVELLIQS